VNFYKILHDLDKNGNLQNTRISPDTKMRFPVNSVQSFHQLNEQFFEIKTTFFGLYGVSSVLPPFMNELTLKNSVSGECFRAFLDVFQKRLYLLKYQVWKQGYSPFFINSFKTSYAKVLRSISGNKLTDYNFFEFYSIAGFLGKKAHSALNLSKICQILTGFPARIQENVEQWIPYKRKTNECRLGDNALLGSRYLDNRHLFFIKINCVTIENVKKLCHDKIGIHRLKSAIKSCLDPSICYELCLEARQGFVQICLNDKKIGLGLGGTLGHLSLEKQLLIKLRNNINCDELNTSCQASMQVNEPYC
jgi:type VI secretion system ImpH/TssG family protein